MEVGVWPELERAHERELDVPVVRGVDVARREDGVEAEAGAEVEREVEEVVTDPRDDVRVLDVEEVGRVYGELVAIPE